MLLLKYVTRYIITNEPNTFWYKKTEVNLESQVLNLLS